MGLIVSGRIKRLKKAGDVAGLAAILRDPRRNPKERRAAVVALGETRSVFAIGPLTGALRDPDVRGPSAEALGRIGEAQAFGALADLMHTTQNPNVRRSAEWAMGALFARDEAGCRRVLRTREEELSRKADRFARRQHERVEAWESCPLCGRPLEVRVAHAVFCSFCDRYVTDPNWVPAISTDGQPEGTLVGAQMGVFSTEFLAELGYPFAMRGQPLFLTDLVWRFDPENYLTGQPVFLDAPLLRMAWTLDGATLDGEPARTDRGAASTESAAARADDADGITGEAEGMRSPPEAPPFP